MAGLMDFLQAASNTAASNVSAPVDGLAWLLRKMGADIPSNPVMGSEWMQEKGLTKPVAQSGYSLAGETMGLLAPMLAAAKAPQIAQGLLQGADNLAAPRTLNPQTGAVLMDYKGAHTAPMKSDSTAPLHELQKIYPDDIYSNKAAQYYGHYGDSRDLEAVRLMQAAKDKPNMPVTMYRAVPYELNKAEQLSLLEKQMANYMKKGVTPDGSKGSGWFNSVYEKRDELRKAAEIPEAVQKLGINNGDWVTLSKAYAKEHGEGALNGKYKIVSQKVPARKLFTDGNSIHEFGYDESGKISQEMLGAMAGAGLLGYGGYNALNDK